MSDEEVLLNYYMAQTPRFYVEKYVGGGGTGWGSATGDTGFSIRLSLTPNGLAIPTLSLSASEETGTSYFFAAFTAALLTAALPTYKGRKGYWILSKTPGIDMHYQPVRIVDSSEVA